MITKRDNRSPTQADKTRHELLTMQLLRLGSVLGDIRYEFCTNDEHLTCKDLRRMLRTYRKISKEISSTRVELREIEYRIW